MMDETPRQAFRWAGGGKLDRSQPHFPPTYDSGKVRTPFWEEETAPTVNKVVIPAASVPEGWYYVQT
jgi:hypothetical protein